MNEQVFWRCILCLAWFSGPPVCPHCGCHVLDYLRRVAA